MRDREITWLAPGIVNGRTNAVDATTGLWRSAHGNGLSEFDGAALAWHLFAGLKQVPWIALLQHCISSQFLKQVAMSIPRLPAISNYLAMLYEHGAQGNLHPYLSFALGGLCDLLDAQKSWCGIISMERGTPHLLGSVRNGLSKRWEECWEDVKSDDRVASFIARSKYTTLALETSAIPASDKLLRLADEFNIWCTLSTSFELPEQSAFVFISIYRSPERPVFSAEDREIKEMLMPHIRAAWRQNLREVLRSPNAADDGRLRAFVTLEGRLVDCDPGVPALVTKRWPDWNACLLPLPLRRAIDEAHTARDQWALQDGLKVHIIRSGLLTLVEFKEASRIDALSCREMEIASLFAGGRSHKTIAKSTGLAPATVRHYVRQIYSKLEVDNKASLATLMIQRSTRNSAQFLAGC